MSLPIVSDGDLCALEQDTHRSGVMGVLLGKGLRIVDVFNVIVQNIMMTDLNPKRLGW